MKIIQANSNIFRAFLVESQKNVDFQGNLLQTLGLVLGFENNGVYKASELLFVHQECQKDFVKETGK